MRIECQSTVNGNVYRVFRDRTPVPEQVVALIPTLHEAGCTIFIGASKNEPDLVFAIGPIYGLLERALRRNIYRYLGPEEETSPDTESDASRLNKNKRSTRR